MITSDDTKFWEYGNIAIIKKDEQSPLHFQVKPKVSAPKILVIIPHYTEKLKRARYVKVEPECCSVNCDGCFQQTDWVIILLFSPLNTFC